MWELYLRVVLMQGSKMTVWWGQCDHWRVGQRGRRRLNVLSLLLRGCRITGKSDILVYIARKTFFDVIMSIITGILHV